MPVPPWRDEIPRNEAYIEIRRSDEGNDADGRCQTASKGNSYQPDVIMKVEPTTRLTRKILNQS